MSKKGFDKMILNAENIDLSELDLKRITNDKTNIISYEELEKVTSIDQVLGKYRSVIILYLTKEHFGHWICLFETQPNHLEFFDPYGLKIDEELNINNEFHLRIHNGMLIPHLSVLLSTSNYIVTYNKTRIQKMLEHVNTCGRHVGVRLRFRDIPLKKYIDLLTKNKYYDPDFWVSSMTLLV